jgi:hypothetical protein
MQKEIIMKTYEVTDARFIAGQHRAVGESVKLSECAAKYYVAPNGTGLKLRMPKPAKQGEKPIKTEG